MRYRTLGLCIVLVLAGCSGATGGDSATTVTASDSPTATATPTETATPTDSPTESSTATETPSPTPTATRTPIATATATPTPSPTPTATPKAVLARDSLNRSEFAAAFREVLGRRNCTVGSLVYRNETLVYEFRSRATNSSEYSREINVAATSYEAVVNDFEGYEPAGLEIRPTGADGDLIAAYDVETAWAHEVENGTRTREEYLRAMAATERR